MNRIHELVMLAGLLIVICTTNVDAAEPEQIHLATTGKSNEMVIQWGTEEDTAAFCSSDNAVEYGPDPDNLTFSEDGEDDMYLWTTCTHTTLLSELDSNATYYYRVGGDGEWSNIFSFKTLEAEPESETFQGP